jgi:hypothetical protein
MDITRLDGKRAQMQKIRATSLFSKLTVKGKPFNIITPILLVILLFAAMITPLHALTPARDLTGTWKNAIPEKYYEMDSFDPTMRMNDVSVTYNMIITQSGNSINIILNVNELSSVTDPAYLNEYGYGGVPIVGFNQIAFTGTVSSASFTADEMGSSTGNAEHLAGTFTTDIITATLTGNSETTDTNGIIVLRDGSSATMPPIATTAPTATPTPAPALPTSGNLGSVSQVQGSAHFADTGAPVTTQSPIGTGAEIQTGSDTIVGFNYPDQGGTVYLGANSDAAWVYPQPQTDPTTGHITYTVVPSPTTGSIPFETGLESDEFGQVAVMLPIEIGVGILILGETLPVALTGAAVVEGTLLLGTGIAYIHEQLSPQEGTCDVRPVQVPQGLVMGAGTEYVVTVSNGSTTIQVIDGSVLFVDQYTNSSITIVANQMLTLPSGVQTGFSVQDLQSDVSAFDASSINQWWTQTTPTATPTTPTATPIITATPTTKTLNGITNFLSQPIFLAVIILVIIIVIAAVLVVARRKTHLRQPSVSNQKSGKQDISQPIMYESPKTTAPITETAATPSIKPDATQPKLIFCPNCGNQLLNTKGLCPFCSSDLSQWYPNAKK